MVDQGKEGEPDLLTAIARPLTHSLLLLGVLVVAGGGSLLVLLAAPPAWSLDVGTAGDTRFLEGFFPAERHNDEAPGSIASPETGTGTFRWSYPEAYLVLYGLGAGPSALSLRLHCDAPAPPGRSLRVQQGEHPFATFQLSPGWRIYRILLPSGAVTGTGFEPARLALLTTPPPTAASDSRNRHDERRLGVPVDRVEIAPLTAPTPTAPFPVGVVAAGRTLLLLWGLALLAGVLWFLNRALEPQYPPIASLWHLQAQLAGAVVLLAAWAWHDPVSLAWVWSKAGGVLVGGTAVLGGVVLLRRFPGLPAGWGNSTLPERVSAALEGLVTRHAPRLTGTTGLAVFTALAHLLLLLPLPVAWHGGAAWFVLGLPGALLALRLAPEERHLRPLVGLFLGLCGGLALAPLLLLLLHALPGAVVWWALLIACDALSVVLVWQRRVTPVPWSGASHPLPLADGGGDDPVPSLLLVSRLILYALVGVGVFFRLAFLGSAEFQGDEGQAMIMAARLVHGQDDILYLHRKGPMEVLLAALPLALTHHVNEWVARLPFVLAGVGVLAGSYLVGSRLFKSHDAGLLAAAILSLEGFMLGFSRIVQYQPIVLLMTLGGLWCCWRFFEGGSWRLLLLAAWLAATGLLAHYDGIFGLPAMVWMVAAGGIQRGWQGRQWVQYLGLPLVVGGGLLAVFYLPFVRHEQFAQTLHYLLEKRIGGNEPSGGMFANNLGDYYLLATFYNPTFLVHTLAPLLAGGMLAWLCAYGRLRLAGWGLAALLLVGCVLLVVAPGAFRLEGSFNWALVVCGLPLAVLVLSPARFSAAPFPIRVALLWFGGAFVTESFVVADPKTHFYTMLPAAALLMGWFIVQSVRWLHRRQRAWMLSPLVLWGAAVVALTVPYLFIVFVRQVPEYERTFPVARRPSTWRATAMNL
ncbi:MAG: phospholipid carrier-dependent glycosyltransferase, partial [Chloroflexaceae bacterium]|nr:phospholipid carrier-dependent glycosyltransferase [Chloroflexaceae bacterium]